jgi:O-antigen ligase
LLFFAAAFLLPTGPAYALVFYLCVLPAFLLQALRSPRPWLRDPGAGLGIALIVWSGMTLIWGHDDQHRTLRFLADTAFTLLFLGALACGLRSPALRRHLGTVMIWAGTVNAVLSLLLGQILPQNGPRLHGWGATSHPILGATVMATAYLCAISRALSEPGRRAAYLAAAAAMTLFILFTESRGPLLAALAATLFLCAASPIPLRALGLIAAASCGWWLLPAGVQQHGAAILLSRGASHRFGIWQRTLEMIAQRPLFGHGLAANLTFPGTTHGAGAGGLADVSFPHDLYLSVLFYSGVVGAVLFLALLATITWRLLQARQGRDEIWLWAAAMWINVLVSGLTDLGQITKGPGPLWFIFWLPVTLTLATYPNEQKFFASFFQKRRKILLS